VSGNESRVKGKLSEWLYYRAGAGVQLVNRTDCSSLNISVLSGKERFIGFDKSNASLLMSMSVSVDGLMLTGDGTTTGRSRDAQ
jgi:hypothetical protein